MFARFHALRTQGRPIGSEKGCVKKCLDLLKNKWTRGFDSLIRSFKKLMHLLLQISKVDFAKNIKSAEGEVFVEMGLSRSRAVKKRSPNGEIHFILPEYQYDMLGKTAEDFDEAEIRRITKKDASKPLLLLRAE